MGQGAYYCCATCGFAMTLQRSQMRAEARKGHPGGLALERGPDSSVVIRLSVPWRMHDGLPSASAVERELEQTKTARVTFEASGVEGWDSSLLTFVTKAADLCKSRNIATDFSGLPAGLTRLIELAEAVPEKMDARAKTEDEDLVHSVGTSTLNYVEATINFLTFLGEVIAGFGRLFTGRARFRRIDLLMDIQDAGVRAFGIVTLISFLVGTILAFMGAVQLSQFGAAIY